MKLCQPYYIFPRHGQHHINLDGEWKLCCFDKEAESLERIATHKALTVNVPTTVQWALYDNNVLPHPYHNLNIKQYDWVDKKVWYYKKTFYLDESMENDCNYALLSLDGADYFTRVWLNEELLGEHEGMFGGPVVEVKDKLNFGSYNTIIIEIKAGNYFLKETWDPWENKGRVIRPWYIGRTSFSDSKDFMPLGLWRGVRLDFLSDVHMDRPFLTTKKLADNTAELELKCEIFVGVHSLQGEINQWYNRIISDYRDTNIVKQISRNVSLKVVISENNTGNEVINKIIPLELWDGKNWIREKIIMDSPKLWWPIGLGEPDLYNVDLTLLENDSELDNISFQYGIRTIETVASAGNATADRWDNWQYVINGREIFLKGMNWMPNDALLKLKKENYRWVLEAAKNCGVQLIRVWGGGLIENDDFYDLCNELGIMVWQEFPMGNSDTPGWPQDVLQAQVVMNIFRLRNHPSLAVWCCGNEFNPYSYDNTATIGVISRNIEDFDNTRIFYRTSPDKGSIHPYPDMDPTWYQYLFKCVPFFAETGTHSIPDGANLRELIDNREFEADFIDLYSESFVHKHKDFIHHFCEYIPERVPRMLSRASHINDLSEISVDELSEATQISSGEFYKIVSEIAQANYPVTTGLLPWVFKRPWLVSAVQMIDGLGHPVAAYYFVKRTYEATHAMIKLENLIWASNEHFIVKPIILHSGIEAMQSLNMSVKIYDTKLGVIWQKNWETDIAAGPSVNELKTEDFVIPEAFEESFFIITAELKGKNGKIISRSVYWPRCLSRMLDSEYSKEYRREPKPVIYLDKGPWLKHQIKSSQTTLSISDISVKVISENRRKISMVVKNTGDKPAYPVKVDVTGINRSCFLNDNFFWLEAKEERELVMELKLRDNVGSSHFNLTAESWNAPCVSALI